MAALLLAVLLAGCGHAQQTRSAALQDYQAEAAMLDRLEAAHDAKGRKYEADLREIQGMLDQLSPGGAASPEADAVRQKNLTLKKKYAEELLADERANIEPQRRRVRAAAEALKITEPTRLTSSTSPPR